MGDGLIGQRVHELVPALDHAAVVPPPGAEVSERLPEVRRREAVDARLQPGLEEHVDQRLAEEAPEATGKAGRRENRVSRVEKAGEEGGPRLSGETGVRPHYDRMGDLQHSFAEEGLVVEEDTVRQFLTRHEELVQLLEDDLGVVIGVLLDGARDGLPWRVERAQPVVVDLDALLHEHLLREGQGQPVSHHLHGPLRLLRGGEGTAVFRLTVAQLG